MLGKLLGVLKLSTLFILIQSCDAFDKEEPIPAYIQVDSVSVISGAETGSASHDINDIWLYVDNKYIGTYEIPFKVPVLPTGNQNIALETGIRDNGLGEFRAVYPFYTSFSMDTILPEAGTLHFNPVYEYEAVNLPLLEDFEGLGNSFEKTPNSDTTMMTVSDSISFEGHSGLIVLDAERTVVDLITSQLYTLPRDRKVYLEMDYYCEELLDVGLFGQQFDGNSVIEVRYPVLKLYRTTEWRKIYINLTDQIARSPYANQYRVFFSAEKTDETEGRIAKIYLDNIKMIHY
ncbi:MAG: hypothetical protein U9N51_11950 [Bacteroidota bacterium]|nr:hypothetical protein [Bacteroidota bacterium]